MVIPCRPFATRGCAMATYSYLNDVDVTAGNTNAIALATFDIVYVAQGVTISASGNGGSAIKAPGSDRFVIAGDIFADYMGIWCNDPIGNNNFVVKSTGSISALSNGI